MQRRDYPPFVSISKSGTYKLKLFRPKDEKVALKFKWSKPDKDTNKTYATCTLFFADEAGNCLNKYFSAKYPQAIAILVGRLTGRKIETPSQDMDLNDLFTILEPAFGCYGNFHLDVKEDKPFNGRPSYKYKFNKIETIGGASNGPAKRLPGPPDDDAADDGVPF